MVRPHSIENSALFRAKSFGVVSRILKVELPILLGLERRLGRSPGSHYAVRHQGRRDVQEPLGILREIHDRLYRILVRIECPRYLASWGRGKSCVDHARVHQAEGRYVLSLDIKKFFASTNREHVLRFFMDRLQVAGDVANLLTNLCCYRGERLALGSPTSQVLAFWSYRALFDDLWLLARSQGLRFTAYVDDLTFSGPVPIPPDFSLKVQVLLSRYRLRLHWRKVQYRPAGQPKFITGCLITADQGLEAPKALKAKTVAAVHRYRNVDQTPHNRQVALGLIQAVRQIEPKAFEQSRLQILGRRVGSVLSHL